MTSGSIGSMKLSVSLPSEDVEFLDEYARTQGYPSRSAAAHAAFACCVRQGLVSPAPTHGRSGRIRVRATYGRPSPAMGWRPTDAAW